MKESVRVDKPISTYQNMQNCNILPSHHGILNPRNREQVRNCQKSERHKMKLSHDSLYNLLLLAYELGDFVHHISIYPDLICAVGLKLVIKEFSKLLECDTGEHQMYCSYDTTFCIGDFYVSPIVFKHVLFQNSPTIPLAFLIHDRKYAKTHEMFFRIIVDLIPNLKKYPVPFIVDREFGLSSAIKTVLPNCPVFHCWNHLQRDFRHHLLTKLAAPMPDVQIYMQHLDEILHCDSEAQFLETSDNLIANWSEPAFDYFNSFVKPDILTYSGKWLIQPYNIFDPYSGITTNMSEGMNTVIKRLLDWTEVPVDSAALAFHFLQNYYFIEIHIGFCGVGEYSLRPKFGNLSRGKENIPVIESYSPENIVQKVKCSLYDLLPDKKNEIKVGDIKDNDVKASELRTIENKISNNKDDKDSDNDNDMDCDDNKNNSISLVQKTPTALAQKIVDEDRIEFVPKLKCYTVRTENGNLNNVQLFPKEKCWCGATITCCHILAARIYVGIAPVWHIH